MRIPDAPTPSAHQSAPPAATAAALPSLGADQVTLGDAPAPVGLSGAQLAKFFHAIRDTATTRVLWESPPAGVGAQGVAAAGDAAVFVRSGDSVSRLDPASGRPLWSHPLATPLPPDVIGIWASEDGRVVTATADNCLRGLDPASGQEAWTFPMGAKFAAPVTLAPDGTVLTFRKNADHLELCRLGPEGALRQAVPLGVWDEPIGDGGCDARVLGQDGDGLLVHASVKVPQPGEAFVPMYNVTFAVSPEGQVTASAHNMEPPAWFAGDPGRFYGVDYQSMTACDRGDGHALWTLQKRNVGYDPKIGPYGDTLFEIGGEFKYKYVKFVDAHDDRAYL